MIRVCKNVPAEVSVPLTFVTTLRFVAIRTHGVRKVACASITNSPGGRSNEADVAQTPVPSHALSAGD